MNRKTGNPNPGALWAMLLAGLLSLATVPAALALPEDRNQPIHVKSDRTEHDLRQGVTIYEGNVLLHQGSLRIKADRITVHTDANDEVQQVLAEGSPAHFEQQPEAEDAPVIAKAYTIRYQADQEQLELLTNALLEQGKTTMRGNRIDYDIARELVRAEGDTNTDSPRVEMVLPPKNDRPQQD